MPRARSIKMFQLPPLDEDLFHDLFDILHETIFKGQWAATARCISVSQKTIKRWNAEPPSHQRWWNIILTHTIVEMVHLLKTSPHKEHRKRGRLAAQQVQRHRATAVLAELERDDVNADGAVRHLLTVVNEAPGQTISTRDLRKAAFSGGYSMRTLRQAATVLCLDKETEGFGEDKVTYWSMPRD